MKRSISKNVRLLGSLFGVRKSSEKDAVDLVTKDNAIITPSKDADADSIHTPETVSESPSTPEHPVKSETLSPQVYRSKSEQINRQSPNSSSFSQASKPISPKPLPRSISVDRRRKDSSSECSEAEDRRDQTPPRANERDWKALRDPKKVAAASAANAELDSAKQLDSKEKIINFIIRDFLTDPLTHQLFIARDRLRDSSIAIPVRARIINQIMDDYIFRNAIHLINDNHYAEIFTRIDMDPSCLNIDIKMVNKQDTYEKFRTIMKIDEKTPILTRASTVSDHTDSEQSFYQAAIVQAIVISTDKSRKSIKEELSNKRLLGRMKPIILNPLFDNPEFKKALEHLSESKFQEVRESIGLPAEAFNVDESMIAERHSVLYRKFRAVAGLELSGAEDKA